MKKAHYIILVFLFTSMFFQDSSATNMYSWNYLNSPLPQKNIYAYSVDSTNQIWISLVNGGIIRTDTYTWQFLDTNNSDIPDYYINEIIVDNKNNKWMGSSRGLIKYDDKTWQNFNDENSSLPSKRLSPRFVDHDNNLWVTYVIDKKVMGIVKFDGINSSIFNDTNSGLLSNIVYAMAQDSDGSYWFSTEGGVVKYDGNNWQTIFREYRTPYDSIVWSICIDSAGTKYFSTSKCIIILKDDKFSYIDTSNTNFYYKSFGKIVKDKKNNLWVTTSTSLAMFDGKDFKVVYGPAYNIKVDNHNNKWFMNYNESPAWDNLVVYNEDGLQGINGVEVNFIARDETQMIYPNPATDFIEISYPPLERGSGGVEIKILNVLGEIQTTPNPTPALPASGEGVRIDVSGLTPGMYFVRVGDKVSKFVKL